VKQFRFKLESVLAYRKLLEDGEEQKLKTILTNIHETEKLQEDLRTKIENGCRLAQERSLGTIDMDKLRTLTAYVERLRQEFVRTSQTLSKLEQDRRNQLESLMKARKGREVVEKLKENSLSNYNRENKVLEQKLLDELSVTQFGRIAEQELPGPKSNL
jgi:flagellar FliJ protein